MSTRLKIPKCIVYIPILIEWLDVIDIAFLDTAVTNTKTRAVFLDYINFDRTVLDGLKNTPLQGSFLRWVQTRNIAVREINILFTPVLYPEMTMWNFWSSDMVTQLSCELFPEGAKYCSKVRSLTLSNANKIHPEHLLDHHYNNGMSSIPSLIHCTNLRELIIIEYSFGMEKNIFEIPGTASMSSSSSSFYSMPVITEEKCTNTSVIGKNLLTLELRQCYEITFDAITYILDNCTRLSTLSITSTQPNIVHDRKSATKKSLSRPKLCPQLTTLNLSNCGRLWDYTLSAIIDRCNYLLSINLQKCTSITDSALDHISRKCLCLLDFNASDCTSITETGVAYVASGCHFLQKIDISHNWAIKDNAILALAEHCTQLSSLNITDCYQITDKSISLLCMACTGLQELLCDYCIHISDESIAALEANCPTFTTLSAGGCVNITLINSLSTACPSISSLRVFKWTNLIDDDLMAFSANAVMLTKLDASDCMQVSDNSLFVIAEHCPLLLEFIATNCINITDAGIIKLVQKCKSLKVLDIENCQAITYDSIDAVYTYARQLTDLRVHEVISDIIPSEDHFTGSSYWNCRSVE